jgi:hypothetical protein
VHCERCHADTTSSIGWILDLGQLVADGQLVPGASSSSRVVEVLKNGHARAIEEDIATPGNAELVARFVDDLPIDPVGCEPLPLVSVDATFEAMAADISAAPADARPFTRYLGLTYASNSGLCGPALERQRRALFEAVNAVSLGENVVLPQAIDGDGLLYRIDIRDYRWDRGIDLMDDGQEEYGDGWLAIVAASGPYAAVYRGVEADAVSREAQTPVPFLPGNALVHGVAAGDLYYALVGVRRDMQVHRLELGVGEHPMFRQPEQGVTWLGFLDDAFAREVAVVRAVQGRPERAYWVIQEQDTGDAESIFDAPFDSESSSPAQISFGLPNGMLAFAIESPEWVRQTSVVSHASCRVCGEAGVGVAACAGCHAAGPVAVRDEVRGVAESNPAIYVTQTLEDIGRYYATPAELDALLQSDHRPPRAALEQLGITAVQRDPLSRVYYQFELGRLTARRAAGELGVSLSAFAAALEALGPELEPLRSGTLERAAFSAAFPAAACQLHAGARNRPSPCP